MIRNLKVMGLALAVLVVGAVAAPLASAAEQGELTSETGVAMTLTATETGEPNQNALTKFGSTIKCPGSTYTGHKYNVTPHELIPNASTTITVTPFYKNCKKNMAGSELPATVTMNGCDYVIHIGTTTPAGNINGTYGVTADLICPVGGKDIEIEVFSGANHLVKLCTTTIKEQHGLSGPHITNTPGKEDLDIFGTFIGLVATESGPACPTTETKVGELHVDLTVKGKNAAGGALGVTVSD